MGLADLMPEPSGSDKKAPVAVSVKVEPLDTRAAAADLLKAMHAHDVSGVENALRVFFAACDDEEDEGEEEEGDEKPSKPEPKYSKKGGAEGY